MLLLLLLLPLPLVLPMLVLPVLPPLVWVCGGVT
jgi:hypothetical protein